jgi:hypothetical protein
MPDESLHCKTCGARYTIDGPPTIDLGSIVKSCGCSYALGEMVPLPQREADGLTQWMLFSGMASGASVVSGIEVWATTDGARCWISFGADGPTSPRALRAGWRTEADVVVAFRWMWEQLTHAVEAS